MSTSGTPRYQKVHAIYRKITAHKIVDIMHANDQAMRLLSDALICGLCMRRECRERFPRHRGLASRDACRER